MRSFRVVLIAMLAVLFVVPFAATANAQVAVGVGVGPAVVADPGYYGPPECAWGYYPYYPYACAPYGYYGPNWFYGGVFIGAGPWYGWGYRGYGYRGGYYGGRGFVGAPRGYVGGGVARGYVGGGARGFSAPSRGFSGGVSGGVRGGGSFGGGARGGFSGGRGGGGGRR